MKCRILNKNYQRIDHRLNLIKNGTKGSLNGFVPCMQHCVEISTNMIKPENLIKNRICAEKYQSFL